MTSAPPLTYCSCQYCTYIIPSAACHCMLVCIELVGWSCHFQPRLQCTTSFLHAQLHLPPIPTIEQKVPLIASSKPGERSLDPFRFKTDWHWCLTPMYISIIIFLSWNKRFCIFKASLAASPSPPGRSRGCTHALVHPRDQPSGEELATRVIQS